MFFVVFVCFPCLVFVPGLHSFDFRWNHGSLDYALKFLIEMNGFTHRPVLKVIYRYRLYK